MSRRLWSLLLLLALLLAPAAVWAGPVSWVEVPPTAEGRQWWDEGSLRINRAGNLTVLSSSVVAQVRDRLRSSEPRSAAVVYPQLSEREREVLHGLSRGSSPAEIARTLGISLNTCRGYLRTLMAKLGARSQREVLAFVARHGLPTMGS